MSVPDRYRNDDRRGGFRPHGQRGGAHRRTGRESVVHQHHVHPFEYREWAVQPVGPFATLQFLRLAAGYVLDHVVVQAEDRPDHVVVDHAHVTRCDRAKSEFGL